jgi:microcystin-dependent protein
MAGILIVDQIQNSSNTALINVGFLAANTVGATQIQAGSIDSTKISSAIIATKGGTGLTSPGASGNVLTSDGTAWTSSVPVAFDSGTRLIFAQTAAPTGWTKDTTNYNNYALRVVTGTASTGGSVDFTTAFASGLSDSAVTLSTAQMPSHSHSYTAPNGVGTSPVGFCATFVTGTTGSTTGSQGSGGSHAHTLPSFAVKYLDVITATKN